MLKKEIISILISIFIIINLTGCTEEKKEENNSHSIFYVDINGGADYIKIQDAINNTEAGGTIYVRNGTYNEVLKIYKKINLIGDVNNKPKIYYNFFGESSNNSIVTISADNCTFTGFDIYFKYFTASVKGIHITSSYNTINFCNVSNVYHGIFLDYNVKNNNISNCIISNTKRGIYINRSSYNVISNNTVTLSGFHGIYLFGADNNIFFKNVVVDNYIGINVQGSESNKFYNNYFKNNSVGLKFCCGSLNNIVYSNNFVENYLSNARDNVNNQWDNGTIGNYWDDYVKNYPNANQTGNIWDTPYVICDDGNNCGEVFDRYPLVSEIIN